MANPALTSLVRIPSTIEEALTSLDGIGQLLTAKGWERAAIVYALTSNQGAGRPSKEMVESSTNTLPIKVFAKKGITGLTTYDTIAALRKAWEEAGGDTDISLGDEVTLPTVGFKDVYVPNSGRTNQAEAVAEDYIAKNPKVVAKAVRSSQAAADAIANDRKAAGAVVDRVVANAKKVSTAPASKPKAQAPMDPKMVLKSMTMDWGSVIADLDTLGRLIEANPEAKQGILDFAPRARSVIDNFERLEAGVRGFRKVVGVDAGESNEVKVIEGVVVK